MNIRSIFFALSAIIVASVITNNAEASLFGKKNPTESCDKHFEQAEQFEKQGGQKPAKDEYKKARDCYTKHGKSDKASKANGRYNQL